MGEAGKCTVTRDVRNHICRVCHERWCELGVSPSFSNEQRGAEKQQTEAVGASCSAPGRAGPAAPAALGQGLILLLPVPCLVPVSGGPVSGVPGERGSR